MTVADARVKVTLPDHPKTKKLIRKCGQAGAWNLIRLFLFVAANRPDGDLAGMDDDDIEIAADWLGDPGALVAALVEVRFLTGEQGKRAVHDWADHNPWASGSEARSEKSRWAALCKQHGRQKAAEMMPEYAASLRVAPPESASGTPAAVPESASGTPLADSGSAPSPSPSPFQEQEQKKEQTRRGSRLPLDWQPTPKQIAWAKSERQDLDVRVEADKFRDFWTAKAGKDAAKLDWDATWRNWIRNARQQQRGPPGSVSQPPKQVQALHAILGVPHEAEQSSRVVLGIDPRGLGSDVHAEPRRLAGC